MEGVLGEKMGGSQREEGEMRSQPWGMSTLLGGLREPMCMCVPCVLCVVSYPACRGQGQT